MVAEIERDDEKGREREIGKDREREKGRGRQFLEILTARPASPRREKRRKALGDAVK